MIVRTVWLLACLSVSPAVNAQQVAIKIGVVNIEKAMSSTQEGQKASQALASKVEPKQKEFSARQQEIASLAEQLGKGENLLSADRKAELERDLDTKKKRLERDTQDAEDAIRTEQQSVLQTLSQKFTAVLQKYAKENGYTLLMESGGPTTSVLYAAGGLDITQDVTASYDKGYPMPSATTPGIRR